MASAVPKNMFTSAEIKKHRDTMDVFTDAAADFLDWVYDDHLKFYAKWGVSKYYGNRKPEHKTRELRIKQLKKFGKPEFLVDQQVSTACILLAMQACERGFNAAGMPNTWKKINNQLKIDQKFYGTDLQIMLQQLGWKIYYWNPDPSQNANMGRAGSGAQSAEGGAQMDAGLGRPRAALCQRQEQGDLL